MQMLGNKKAQAVSLQQAAIGFVIIAITIFVGAQLLSNQQTLAATSGAIVNESETGVIINNTLSFAQNNLVNGSITILALNTSNGSVAGSVVTNVTKLLTLGADGTGNFTVDNLLGTFRVTSPGLNNSAFLINYSYATYSATYNVSQNGNAALQTIGSNMSTLSLVIVFGFILFFLGRYLTNRGPQ